MILAELLGTLAAIALMACWAARRHGEARPGSPAADRSGDPDGALS